MKNFIIAIIICVGVIIFLSIYKGKIEHAFNRRLPSPEGAVLPDSNTSDHVEFPKSAEEGKQDPFGPNYFPGLGFLSAFIKDHRLYGGENPPASIDPKQSADPPINKDPSNHHGSFFIPKRLALRDIEREGIGYPKGYATFEALFAPSPRRFMPMIDIRAHHLYNDTYAVNAGLIGRYVSKSFCRIYGLNVYWDYRQGKVGNYQQLGVGFETLGKRFDFRFNGNIGIQKHMLKCKFEFSGDRFSIFRKKEFSFEGFNSEIGSSLVNSKTFLLYAAAGPYYLSRDDQRAWGGKARLRPQYKDFLALELSTSYDHIFHAIFQGEIILSLPLYPSSKRKKCLLNREIYQPVHRFEIIPLKKRCGWETNWESSN